MSEAFEAWILRAGATGFTAGCRTLLPDGPRFGDLVEAQGHFTLFGLIYNITVPDDLLARQLVLAGPPDPVLTPDQRATWPALIELNVLAVGYRTGAQEIEPGLPPQPPASLDTLRVCDEADLRAFTANLAYLPLVLNTPHIPADELLAAHLVRAAAARPPATRTQFLLGVGRELARLLNPDLVRLEGLLRKIKPGEDGPEDEL